MEPERPDSERIERNIQRILEIYSSQQEEEPQPVDVHNVNAQLILRKIVCTPVHVPFPVSIGIFL